MKHNTSNNIAKPGRGRVNNKMATFAWKGFLYYYYIMNRKRTLSSVLIFVIYISLSIALPVRVMLAQSLPIKHYTIEDNLASSFVGYIYQDSRGFFWFGTHHGLSRFNGVEFRNFYARDGLPDDFIQAIQEDKKGNLWLGTLGGGLVRKNEEGFTRFTMADGLGGNRVFSIAMEGGGNLWIGTSGGLTRFDGSRFVTYTDKNGLTGNTVKRVILDRRGGVWAGTMSGLNRFFNGRFVHFTTKDGLPHNQINSLLIDNKGDTWIGTENGLCRYRESSRTLTTYLTRHGLPNNSILSLMQDRNGNIWIGTHSGLSLYSNGHFRNFYRHNGLLNDTIHAVYEGREGNIWMGTNTGVSMLHSLRLLNFSTRDGLAHNVVWTILEDSPGSYWIGTDKGVSRYSGGTFTSYTEKDGLSGNSVYGLLKDRRGNILMATSGGISLYRGGAFTNTTEKDGLPHPIVLSMMEDRQGVIWVGTLKGLCRFRDGRPLALPFRQVPYPIHAILEDRRGHIWFSDSRAIRCFSKTGTARYSTIDGLAGNTVNSIFEDSRGNIWIATQKGLSRLKDGIFTNYTTEQGLSDDMCTFVLEDNSGNLWIGTGKGVDRFDGKTFKNYSSKNGLISSETCQKACLKDSGGLLWFGTTQGLVRFEPGLDKLNTVPPPVYLTHVKVLGKDIPFGSRFDLNYNQKYMEIQYVGLCYTAQGDISYKYRMQGADSSWFETRSRSVLYPSLAPGEYKFQVKAVNNDGIESTQPIELRFRILPPFWQTWWFYMASILCVLLLVTLLLLWNVKRAKQKVADEARNKQLVMAQRMQLMGMFAGGAVHDLKNLLSIIIGYSKLLVVEYAGNVGSKDKNNTEALDMIKNSASTAVQVVKQILAFTRQSYDTTSAVNITETITELLQIIKITMPPGIRLHWSPSGDDRFLFINPVKFKQLALNLCLNAIQAIPEDQAQQGEVIVSVVTEPENKVVLEVSDNGFGIEPTQLDRIFTPLFTTKKQSEGTGLGLFVVKQIADEFNGQIQVRSTPGIGTTFRVSFPSAT
jgi:ligand-binding sensor domain-containing protein/signal transduction histidine kinase